MLHQAIGIFPRNMQVQGDRIRTVGRYREIVQVRVIDEEGIVRILQVAAGIDSKIDTPGIVRTEFERTGLFHSGRYRPYLGYAVIGHLRCRIPSSAWTL